MGHDLLIAVDTNATSKTLCDAIMNQWGKVLEECLTI
jgi:hypothetical protein